MAVLRSAWTTERFTFHGTYFSYNDVRIVPPPLQETGLVEQQT
jgi:alkanesulfonate monooxygenase SsuD/methylene tetrahydromethanopterin reductase-like flavin-dependent oxidoreductase (luciferase family)